jgi:hypothetical protein
MLPSVPSSSMASSTASRLCAGSPMPMNTTLLTRRRRRASATWATISPLSSWRSRPSLPVMQNTQPTAQPTWVDTHRPSRGSSTLSTAWPSASSTSRRGCRPRRGARSAACRPGRRCRSTACPRNRPGPVRQRWARRAGRPGGRRRARHHADLAGLVVLDEVGHRAHTGGDLVAQHVGHHRCAAAVGHGHEVQLVLLAHHLDEEFGGGGRRGDAHRALAAALSVHIRAQPADVVVEALGRGAAGNGQRVDKTGEAGHRHEVLRGVVAGVLHHHWQDGDGVVVRQEQGRGRRPARP